MRKEQKPRRRERTPQRVASDKITPAKGRVTIRIRDVGTEKVVQTIEGNNLLVNNWRTQVLFALVGGSTPGLVTDWALNRSQLGTDNTAPAVTDTTITNPEEVALTASYPSSKSIQLNGTLAAVDGNGVTYQEIGLLFSGAGLAARRTFDPVAKSATFEWDIEWVIEWA